MADVELVIKIPEECYEQIQKHMFSIAYDTIKTKEEKKQVEEKFNVVLAIKNGILLPKGHDRLIDAKDYAESILKHYFDNKTVIRCTEIALDNAETIVEADKEND